MVRCDCMLKMFELSHSDSAYKDGNKTECKEKITEYFNAEAVGVSFSFHD